MTNSNAPTKLTELVRAGGCGSKLGPQELREALTDLPRISDPNLLFGTGSGDDAGAYKLTPDLAIIQTVDFFTPIVDDPYDFGAIAATNALSDCYALGATPKTVLNIFCFPRSLGVEIAREILRGGADKVKEAEAVVIGGHSVDDKEPKFGLAVTGVCDPKKLIYNSNAKPGDVLILTKPIGTGTLMNAAKKGGEISGVVKEKAFQQALDSMKTLNKTAGLLMHEFGVTAATDVTGFGLLGHARNIAEASKVSLSISYGAVPGFLHAKDLAKDFAGGAGKRNLEWVNPIVDRSPGITDSELLFLCDAQTSGPLLMAVPEKNATGFLKKLGEIGVSQAAVIGEVRGESEGWVRVIA